MIWWICSHHSGGNYGRVYLDYLFGTDADYKAYLATIPSMSPAYATIAKAKRS